MSEARTVAQQRIDARLAMLKHGGTFAGTVTDEQKKLIVELIEHGATTAEIETLEGMPSAVSIWRACKADPAFDQAVTEARDISASNILDEAQHQLRQALEGNDADAMKIAADYARGSTAYVEKIAPRKYGAMVKHAGADGGALSVAIINYAPKEMGAIEVESESVARERCLPSPHGIAEG